MEWRALGELIEEYGDRNEEKRNLPVLGLNKDKMFMPTVANLEGVDISKYKVIHKGTFAFSGMQTGRDVCIRIGLFHGEDALVSPAYTTFRLKEQAAICKEYLFMFFLREEEDRQGWFLSDSSVRANLDWLPFCSIKIPVPSLEEQRAVVEAWQGLRRIKEENEQLAEPLMALCRSYLQAIKKKYPMREIGEYITCCDERNSEKRFGLDDVRGISIEKKIIETKADMSGVSLESYKLLKSKEFCFVTVTSRNGGKISCALNQTSKTYLVSSTYEVFKIDKPAQILPDFLGIWFCRPEFDRYARFNSWGSARETFSWADICRVKLPLPPLEIQQAVVDVYRCASEAKQLASEADRLSREICPALIQKVIRG